jgi:hypothetical protein
LRELIEETGYGGDGEGAGTATVEDVSPLLVRLSPFAFSFLYTDENPKLYVTGL